MLELLKWICDDLMHFIGTVILLYVILDGIRLIVLALPRPR